jgi:cytochrome P450
MSLLSRLFGRQMPPQPRPLTETIDFNAPDIAANPYPHWAVLRALGPVHHLPATGGWMVLGYDAVKEALARPDLFSNASYRDVDAVLLGEDPPRQAEVRRLISRHFTPDALVRLEGTAARAARAATGPRFDAVAGFAQPVSRAVAADLIGFDAATLRALAAAIDAVAGEPLPALLAALEEFGPRAALYKQLLRDGEGLIGEEEARSLIRLLWLASNTTTERVIARCILRLVAEPDLQAAIRADRALMTSYIEEVMRLHAPEHVLPRVAVADSVLAGVAIPAGASVFLCVGAANRDPAEFEDPDALSLARGSKRHLAFGGGIHHCVGAPLARRVVASALGAMLDSAPTLRAAEPLDTIPCFATLTALAPVRIEVST